MRLASNVDVFVQPQAREANETSVVSEANEAIEAIESKATVVLVMPWCSRSDPPEPP